MDYLIQANDWIEQAGNTLEGYLQAQTLLEYLNPDFFRSIQWLRKMYKYVEHKPLRSD